MLSFSAAERWSLGKEVSLQETSSLQAQEMGGLLEQVWLLGAAEKQEGFQKRRCFPRVKPALLCPEFHQSIGGEHQGATILTQSLQDHHKKFGVVHSESASTK